MKYVRGAVGQIREAHFQGERVPVILVTALVESVISAMGSDGPELVPLRVLNDGVSRWNSLPVTNGHPLRNGYPISANSPDVLASHGIGSIFRAHVEGTKLLMDAYISPRKATTIGAHRLLERLRSGEVCEVSIGAHVTIANTPGVYAGRRYQNVWASLVPDHLAVLENTKGACDVEFGGCGANRSASAHHARINNRRDTIDYEPPDSYAASVAALRTAYAQALIIPDSSSSELNSLEEPKASDPQIRSACRLLTSLGEPTPALTSITVAPLDDLCGRCDRGSITIDPSSPMYVAAQHGDYLPLAMLIAHEHHHTVYGDDETSAFASSLAFLQRHNGDPALIADVKTHLANTFSKDTQ